MRKKRVTYRPGKTAGAFGVIWGSIFILIGVFVVKEQDLDVKIARRTAQPLLKRAHTSMPSAGNLDFLLHKRRCFHVYF